MLMLGLSATLTRAATRIDSLINFDWKFMIGDLPAAKGKIFADGKWQRVHLPHDGSIAGGFDTVSGTRQNGFRPRHIGWYRKALFVPASAKGKVITLEFEGVYRAAEVWVNGKYLGKHLNGYTGFTYEVSQHLIAGSTNTIAVRYDNTYKQSSRWYTGEGIYRNVWLHITNALHIAENGTYITTPFIGDDKAKIAVQTEVVNQADTNVLAKLRTVVISPDGKEVTSMLSVVPLRAHQTYNYQQSTTIDHPVIWDITSPKLYHFKSYLSMGDQLRDERDSRSGIRTIDFTPEQGFLLNGRKVFLNGVNIHHDLGPLGAAAFDKGFKRRLLGLQKMGANAIRLAHNPYTKAVLNMCDELGILVFNEAFDKWSSEYYGPREDFKQHWRPDMAWFIKRDRSHPSVIIWSVGNEVAVKQEYKDTAFVVQLNKMVDLVHQLDPSRKATSGLYPSRDEDSPAPMAFHMDVMSDNYMTRFYKRDRVKFPQLIYLASEMTTDNGGENFFNYDHSYACGQFYWGGNDYIGESFKWPSKGWNGLIDWCDHWKPITYYIQSLYSEVPMVKIAVFDASASESRVWNDVFMNTIKMSDSWNWKTGQKLTLYTFTTGDEVELFINDRSVGVKYLKDFPKRKISWELNYEPGTIKAIARKNGKTIATDVATTAGKAEQIILRTDSTHFNANGLDLAYVTVTVVDSKGTVVQDANNDIKFEVSGEANIAGVANNDRMSDQHFVADHRRVNDGRCLLVLRSTRKSGKVHIKASAPGLKSQTLTLTTN